MSYYKDWWEYTPDSSIGTGYHNIAVQNFIHFQSPANHSSIKADYVLQQSAQLFIMDVNGNIVYSRSLEAGKRDFNLTLHDLPPGYLLLFGEQYMGKDALRQNCPVLILSHLLCEPSHIIRVNFVKLQMKLQKGCYPEQLHLNNKQFLLH